MRIGELAKSVGVGVETVRYYQRIGLLGVPQKPFGGMRSYSIKDLQKLRFIRRAQQLGFSLEDIQTLLELSSFECEQVQKLASDKLKAVHEKLVSFAGSKLPSITRLSNVRNARSASHAPLSKH
jgi:MerR family mercuric resistance operon transcriptional regulator